jgi:hypothetical protein
MWLDAVCMHVKGVLYRVGTTASVLSYDLGPPLLSQNDKLPMGIRFGSGPRSSKKDIYTTLKHIFVLIFMLYSLLNRI